MALAVTVTPSTTALSMSVAVTGASGTLKLYRTTSSSVAASPASAIAAGTLTAIRTTTSASLTYVDTSVASDETYYYVAVDSSTSAYDDGTIERDVLNLIKASTGDLLVREQNQNGLISTREKISAGYVYLLLVESTASLTEAELETLVEATGRTCKVVAGDQVTAVTGYNNSIDLTAHAKYVAANS